MKKIFIYVLISISLSYCSSNSTEEDIPPIPNYTLSVTAGEGGSVSSIGGSYESGEVVTITATANSEYVFSGWSNGSTDNPLTITINSNKIISASFDKKKYTLTISKIGEGSVTEELISSGKSADYNSGSVVRLTAIPSVGWGFTGWTGDFNRTDNPIEVNISEAKSIIANFEQLKAIYLDENGVTMKAYDYAVIGNVYELDGVNYTVVDNTLLYTMTTNGDDLSKVITTKVTNMSYLFEARNMNNDIRSWDTSNVTNMNGMFRNSTFNKDIGSWDTSNVTTMKKMFQGSLFFNKNIGEWDTSNVVDMTEMFKTAKKFNQDISDWDTSNVTNMMGMFEGISDMSEVYPFNQDIGEWDVSNVTNMQSMFTWSAFNQDIGNWDVSNVTTMLAMFNNSSFNQPIGEWDVSSVTNMGYMFARGSFNQDIGNWDVSNVTDMSSMFDVFNSGEGFDENGYPSNISKGQTSIDQNIGNIGSWNTANVTNMGSMFANNYKFNIDISNWDTSNVVIMNQMFMGNTEFNQDISGWNTSNIQDMWKMFFGATLFNQDLSGWCMSDILTEPEIAGVINFASESALTDENKPVWGTCPSN